VLETEEEQDEAIRAVAETELAEAEAQAGGDTSPDDFPSDSSDDDYQPIPQMPPRAHDHEAGGSNSAPP
jgi:hypothetical protein